MPKRPAACRSCQRPEREVGRISLSGLCTDCGAARQLANIAQLQAKAGPYYEHWVAGLIAAGQERIARLRDQAAA